jgi:type I restriction enzyme, S subunit
MKGWKATKIGQVCKVGDGAHASIKRVPEGILYLTSKNFNIEGIQLNNVDFISNEEYEKHFKINSKAITRPQGNDILLSIIGSLGAPYLVRESDKFGLSSSVSILRPSEEQVLSEFLYYWIKSDFFQKSINQIRSGVAQSFLSLEMIKNLPVQYPSNLEIQRKIASVLSAYDDLIENNLKRIKLLEELAQHTFGEWFVKFRINGKQLKVNKETGLPQGWERKALKDVAFVNHKSIKSGFSGKLRYLDISSVSTGKIDSFVDYEFEDAPGRARRIVTHGDIIWSCVRPNKKSYSIIWNPDENLIASTGFAVITPYTLPTSYLYQFLTTDAFVGYLTNLASGAAYPAVTSKVFEDAEVVVPSNDLVDSYNERFKSTIDLISNLTNQNRLLKEARDILLPRLMSGAIDVEEVEEEMLSMAAEPESIYESQK